jgi:large subunit ribosomal protein L11
MKVKLLIEGGSMKPGPVLSQKLGPLGININQVIQEINKATKNLSGLKVPVELDVDTSTNDFEIEVFSPPVSELLKKELGIEKGSGIQGKMQVANASIEQIISIAKTKLPNLLCKDLRAAVKTVVGSCVSLGILIENKSASEIEKDIDEGKYDKEIKEQITETAEEKKTELSEYFAKIKADQEKLVKEEEAEKLVKEEEAEKEVKEEAEAPEDKPEAEKK